MSQLKNAEGIIGHLQRIFMYGDEAREETRVNSFLDFLKTRANPFTQKAYELGARSLYRYICGEQHFPFDLITPLVDWSADERLMNDYGIRPSVLAQGKLQARRESLTKDMEKLRERIETIDAQMMGAEQLPLKITKKIRAVK